MGLEVLDNVLGIDVGLDSVDLALRGEVDQANSLVVPWLAYETSGVSEP